MKLPPRSLERLRKDAKEIAKRDGKALHEAQEIIARANEFPNWKALIKALDVTRIVKRETPQVSMNFAADEDVGLDPRAVAEVERKADIPVEAKVSVAQNAAYFGSLGIEFSIFEPTRTGLEKSILDATLPVRTHFEIEKFHSFEKQGQGGEHKVLKDAFFVHPHDLVRTRASLYRPKTKKGDPRMWYSGLSGFASPADQIAIVVINDALYLFNFSHALLAEAAPLTQIKTVIGRYLAAKGSVAIELLLKLKAVAKNPIRSVSKGDTAVGMAVEAALGIPPNSEKKPDYRGIELKSGRGRKNRSTIFAQVGIWELSKLKSSAEILDGYGYPRGTDFKLYCTVSTLKPNSRGLQLFVDETRDLVIERDMDGNDVVVWTGDLLRNRLAEKHAETFWIDATSVERDGVEFFNLHTVIHTKQPLLSQLMPLIKSGVITLDHLIKRDAKAAVKEKGPLFKINKRDLSLLFPSPRGYTLGSLSSPE
jgi:hypothetical protein